MNTLTKSTMINRKFIFTFYAFVFSINFLNAQVITMKDLYGKWNVSNWIVLNTTAQTNDEKKKFEKQKKKCLKSIFIIDSVTIKNNCNECEFVLCSKPFDSTTKINELPIIEDNENTKRYPGNEIEETNFVGNTFIRLLDKSYNKNKMAMVKTNCSTESANNIRILIVSKNKIGLYSGEDLIILIRNK